MSNKYQEAFEAINCDGSKFLERARNFVEKYKENPVAVIRELVDKETPMRVGSYTGSEWKFRGKFICPRCNKILSIRNLPIRCDSCGQKLDFGGE